MVSDKIWEEFSKASGGDSLIVHDALREALAENMKAGLPALQRHDVIERIKKKLQKKLQAA